MELFGTIVTLIGAATIAVELMKLFDRWEARR